MPSFLRSARVGYAPSRPDCSSPNDRRRFLFYSKSVGLNFEIADPRRSYDVVVVGAGADITTWSRYKKGRLVFELVDSYLSIPKSDPKAAIRGLGKFLTGESRRLRFNYRRAIEDMCQRADAVLCSTPEQRSRLLSLAANVHVILDYHEDLVTAIKTDYAVGQTLNLIWEGLPDNLTYFRVLVHSLSRLAEHRPVALHLVTDPTSKAWFGRFRTRPTSEAAQKLFANAHVHAWTPSNLAHVATTCDLGLIPLDLTDPLVRDKSENKLLLLWRFGVPTITSATTAYVRVMKACGLNMTCSTEDEWLSAMEKWAEDASGRYDAGTRARLFVEANYSEQRLVKQWDRLFETVLAG